MIVYPIFVFQICSHFLELAFSNVYENLMDHFHDADDNLWAKGLIFQFAP